MVQSVDKVGYAHDLKQFLTIARRQKLESKVKQLDAKESITYMNIVFIQQRGTTLV